LNPIIFILGPTCSGKTDLSFYLSSKLNACMINADSIQVYQGFDIGSAKPRKKFYLLDHVTPPEIYTAGQYEKEARSLLKKHLPHQMALVVGGSGFYLQTLERGCYPISKMSKDIKQKLLKEEREKGLPVLYQRLTEKDPEYAVKIHSHDRYRIFRALSLMETDSLKMSEVKKKFQAKKLPYRIIKVGATGSSAVLRKRVELRAKNMLACGLVGEVRELREKGLENFPAMKSVGYYEVLLYLRGRIREGELYEKIVQRTMQLIRKQKIWFKRDPSIRWYDCETDFSEILQDLRDKISGF